MKCREGKQNAHIAVKTRLFKMIFGCCSRTKSYKELHEALKQYFSPENMGISKPSIFLSNDDRGANELLQTLTSSKYHYYESELLW